MNCLTRCLFSDEEIIDFYVSTGSLNSTKHESPDIKNTKEWLKSPDILYSCKCRAVDKDGYSFPSHLAISDQNIYILRDIPMKKDWSRIITERRLQDILKITSKTHCREIITFKYGTVENDDAIITDYDTVWLNNYGDTVFRIKELTLKVLGKDTFDR